MGEGRARFHDHFSGHAAAYAAHRPTYPDALYDWVAAHAPATTLCWDVATGNGQAALGLAGRFDAVFASDASPEQVAMAPTHPRVRWASEPAERCGLADGAADAITVAQALHWFDHAAFFAEAQRVLRPGGLFVAWCYELLTIDDAIDAEVRAFYEGPIGPYWPPQRRHIEAGYRDIEVPFAPLEVPPFAMQVRWDRAALIAYFGTWSAVRRHDADRGGSAVLAIDAALRPLWPDGELRTVTFPLSLRAGRREDGSLGAGIDR